LTEYVYTATGHYSLGRKSVDSGIREALSEAVDLWMDIDGVNGVAMSQKECKDCLLVTVDAITPEVERRIPPVFKGFAVEILATGPITAEEPG
jgi:hypothetical protein